MLRQFIISEPQRWNKLIPFVYLAYWDVSQSSTNLSPLKCATREFPIRAHWEAQTSLTDDKCLNDISQI